MKLIMTQRVLERRSLIIPVQMMTLRQCVKEKYDFEKTPYGMEFFHIRKIQLFIMFVFMLKRFWS